MTNERRQEIYSTMFHFMIDNDITRSIPLKVAPLCEKLGVILHSVSRITDDTGLTENEVFDICGNEDGVIQRYKGTHKISYNDRVLSGRVRFTLCEELAHMVLGHTKDKEFNIFSQHFAPKSMSGMKKRPAWVPGFYYATPNFSTVIKKCLLLAT